MPSHYADDVAPMLGRPGRPPIVPPVAPILGQPPPGVAPIPMGGRLPVAPNEPQYNAPNYESGPRGTGVGGMLQDNLPPSPQPAPVPTPEILEAETPPGQSPQVPSPVVPPVNAPPTADTVPGGIITTTAPPGETNPFTGQPTPGPAPSPSPGTPPEAVTEFGPGNDLRSSQFNPVASGRLGGIAGQADRARALTAQGLETLTGTPDRQTLARQSLENFISSTDPSYQQRLRQSSDLAASMGRVGSGMAADDITRLGRGREAEIIQQSRELASETAGRELEDRFGRLNAARGVAGDFGGAEAGQYGLEASRRGELRGERGYQGDLAQQAIQNRAQQRALEASLQGQAFGQNLDRARFGADVAGSYDEQGQNAQQAAAEAARMLAVRRSLGITTQPGAVTRASGGPPVAPTMPVSRRPEVDIYGRPIGNP